MRATYMVCISHALSSIPQQLPAVTAQEWPIRPLILPPNVQRIATYYDIKEIPSVRISDVFRRLLDTLLWLRNCMYRNS